MKPLDEVQIHYCKGCGYVQSGLGRGSVEWHECREGNAIMEIPLPVARWIMAMGVFDALRETTMVVDPAKLPTDPYEIWDTLLQVHNESLKNYAKQLMESEK